MLFRGCSSQGRRKVLASGACSMPTAATRMCFVLEMCWDEGLTSFSSDPHVQGHHDVIRMLTRLTGVIHFSCCICASNSILPILNVYDLCVNNTSIKVEKYKHIMQSSVCYPLWEPWWPHIEATSQGGGNMAQESSWERLHPPALNVSCIGHEASEWQGLCL